MEIFKQFIQYKALDFKFSRQDGGDSLIDYYIEQITDAEGNFVGEEVLPVKIQNVCAKLPQPLVDRLDNTVKLLGLSKRRFIEMALVEALESVDAIVEELDVFADFADQEGTSHE